MPDTADDPVAAAIADKHADLQSLTSGTFGLISALGRLQRAAEISESALAAVDAAREHHKPLPGPASSNDDPYECPHRPDDPRHFWGGESGDDWLCGYPAQRVCSCFESPDGNRLPWPCDELNDILAALKGVSCG